MTLRCAVIFQSHVWSAVHTLRYERLRREIGDLADCHILFHAPADAELRATIAAYPEAQFFESEELQQRLGYRFLREQKIVPGSAHFPILEFSRRHAYDRYWLIESDVEFSGNWSELIKRTSNSDAHFITSHIRSHAETPSNMWWRSLSAPNDLPTTASGDWRCMAFLPVARFSAQALRAVDQAHQLGWRGHAEALIPSVLRQAGLEMADLKQFGALYQPQAKDPVARTNYRGSMRWRPLISLNEFAKHWAPDTLYHPVKSDWTFGPDGVTRERHGRLRKISTSQLQSARWE